MGQVIFRGFAEDYCRRFIMHMDVLGFVIGKDVVDFAIALVENEVAQHLDLSKLLAPPSSIRPAMRMVLAMQGLENKHDGYCVLLIGEMDKTNSTRETAVAFFDGNHYDFLGAFAVDGRIKIGADLRAEWDREGAAFVIAVCAFVLSLINQPSMLRKEPLVSRQQRRAAERAGKKSASDWHRVTWNIGAEVTARVSADPSFRKVPLHWRRGHFRRAEAHYAGAMRRPDALREEERDLWWQWIDGQWVGHPCFGVKRSIHAPRLSPEVVAARG